MKYYILHVFRTLTPSKKKPVNHFKNLQTLKLLTKLDVHLTAYLEGVEMLCSTFDSLFLLEMKSD